MFSLLGVIFNSPILNLTTIPECSILYRNSLTSGINFSVSHGYNTLPNKILSIRVTEDTAKLLNLLILLLFIIFEIPSIYILGKNTIESRAFIYGIIYDIFLIVTSTPSFSFVGVSLTKLVVIVLPLFTITYR